MPLGVTVVIPTYNREQTLARAIRSAIEQDAEPANIIVVDDGSTDKTESLVRTFGGRVRYIRREHAGVSATRNAGVAETESDWIAFLDSDDYWLPEHLSKIALAIEHTKGEACCYFSNAFDSRDRARTYWELCDFDVPVPFYLQADASEWALMRIQPMLLPASVVQRRAFLDVGGLHGGMRTREDTLLFYKLALRYPFCAVANNGLVIADDGTQRLTRTYDSRHQVYWASSILMYKELLSGTQIQRTRHRQIVQGRLSDAHRSMAKVHLQGKDYGKATASVVAAVLASPMHFVKTVLARIGTKSRARRESKQADRERGD